MTTAQSLPLRMIGVVRSPRRTFEELMAAPRWAGVLAVTFLVSAVSSAFLLETEVGELALLDRWEQTALAFGFDVDDARHAAMRRASEHGVLYAIFAALASGPALALAASVLLAASSRDGRRSVSFRQVFSVTAHAGVILAIRDAVAAPMAYARETLASPATLKVFFRSLDDASPLARLLPALDVFVLWWCVVLAVGASELYRRPAGRFVLLFAGAYVLLAAALAAASALALSAA